MIYYLDKNNGNNTNDGLTIETAFATWSKVLAVNNSGDTVYVLPAYYNEVITTTQNGVKYIAVNDGVDSSTQDLITSSITYSGNCYISAFDSDDNLVNSNVRIMNNKNDVWFVGFTIICYNQDCYTGLVTSTDNLIHKCNIESRRTGQNVVSMGGWNSNNNNIIRKCNLYSAYRNVENINRIEYCKLYATLSNSVGVNLYAFNTNYGGYTNSRYCINNNSIIGGSINFFSSVANPAGNCIIYNNYIENGNLNCYTNQSTINSMILTKNYSYIASTMYSNLAANTSNTLKLSLNDIFWTSTQALPTGTQYNGSAVFIPIYKNKCLNETKIDKHKLGISIDDSKYTVSGSSLNYFMNYHYDLSSSTYNSQPTYYNPNGYTLFYSTSNFWKIVNLASVNDLVANFYSGSTLNGVFDGNGAYTGDTCYMYDYVNLVDYYGYSVDIDDMPLRNYDNKMQIGATQTSDIQLIDDNTIKINRRGFFTFKLKVQKYNTYNIDVNLTFSGATNPEIRIYDYENNDIIKNIEYQLTGLSNGIETNVDYINFTANKTGIIRIIFYNTDYNVNSYLQIKDFKIHIV